MGKKQVYFFGDGRADGMASLRELLGGKGANLAEMSSLGLPVPAGFTITTEVCTEYFENKGKLTKALRESVEKSIGRVGKLMKKTYGDGKNPLLVSVRSGARLSMPGMMDSVLNVGLSAKTLPGLIAQMKDPRFAYDAYRRLITMYADVVMEKAGGHETSDGEGVRAQLESAFEALKDRRGVQHDFEISAEDLEDLCEQYKEIVARVLGEPFPDDAKKQLWGAIRAVFQSWNGARAIEFRRIEGIPDSWGTAVNVQAMVFGNRGEKSATGVAFTRNPATGENVFYGEWLPNAQGEDVVAGIRTPRPLNATTSKGQSLEELHPRNYKKLGRIRRRLERHYKDMQDLEFTIEDGELWVLQTRTGKRTGLAAVRMAVEMAESKLISRKTALRRVKPSQIEELLHPMLDPYAEAHGNLLASGLPAGPGGAVGRIVFTADEARAEATPENPVVLVRTETSPEDVHGMHAAAATLTARGGMTSHAALVARGWGKCCIVGCKELNIDTAKRRVSVNGSTLEAGDWISLNGSAGNVYAGRIPVIDAQPEQNEAYRTLMKWADETRQLGVRTNAERPDDAERAFVLGAEGIGLCRTEHMFFEPERILHMRSMILAETPEARRDAVMKLLPFQRDDFERILNVMRGKPVTIRLLDPPLHEFITLDDEQIVELSKSVGIPVKRIRERIEQLHEQNPMLGHRGCRLGIKYPEITEMQARAILEAASSLKKKKISVKPEIMIPLVSDPNEFAHQEAIVRRIAAEVERETKVSVPYLVGTMVETPRACIVAGQIAERAEFFSFGTNDLTQMTFGFSRDDAGKFLPAYTKAGILEFDPFQTLDEQGVGELVRIAVRAGRKSRPEIKLGLCGEHGGDPASIDFCHRAGLDYVSCSPFRVPVARLAAAHAALKNPRGAKKKPRK